MSVLPDGGTGAASSPLTGQVTTNTANIAAVTAAAALLASGAAASPQALIPLTTNPDVTNYYHYAGTGESLNTGSHAVPVFAPVTNYGHQTFVAGTRASKSGSVGTNPGTSSLAQLFNNTASANGDLSNGQDSCQGACNGFTEIAARLSGVVPGTQLFVASAAGDNGQTIEAISPGGSSISWQLFQDHCTEFKARLSPSTISMPACDFPHGASDLSSSVATLTGLVTTLQAAIETFAQSTYSQTGPVPLLISQMSSDITGGNNGNVQEAQYSLCLNNNTGSGRYDYTLPGYMLAPYYVDGLHYLNIGQLIRGNYNARNMYYRMVRHVKPPWLYPLYAWAQNNNGVWTLYIKFSVPKLPLVWKANANTPQKGFQLTDASGDIALTNWALLGDTFSATMSRAPSTSLVAAAGYRDIDPAVTITTGCTIDLRDSTADSFTHAGTTYPMPYGCPHFRNLPVFNLGGQ